jgi:hypothetical protein
MDIAMRLLPSFVQIDTTRLFLGGIALALLIGLAVWFFKPAADKMAIRAVPSPQPPSEPTYVSESAPAPAPAPVPVPEQSAGELPEPISGLMPDLGQGMSA